jgi:hypothetical protein
MDRELSAEERIFRDTNFMTPLNEYQLKEFGVPSRYSRCRKSDVLPEHVPVLSKYVNQFTVGNNRESSKFGLVLNGDKELCMTYMSVLLQRIGMRKRSISCGSVYDIENDCRDRDWLSYLASVDILGVYSFPFFMNGLPVGKDELLMTPFHQMLLKRHHNCAPTIFVTHLDLKDLLKSYDIFPNYMCRVIEDFNRCLTFERSKS